MSYSVKPLWYLIIAFALVGVGAFLFADLAKALGRREKPPEIVVGRRAYEKRYGRPYEASAWRILETKIEDDLRAIWATDMDHAWAAGVSGGLYRTSDAGETWEPLAGFDFARFTQILWKSPNRGFALAKDGKILRSDNGGDRWKTLRFGPGQQARQMAFVDADTGWAVGDRGLILHTTDGGDTWDRQRAEGAGDLAHIQMLSAKTGWAVGRDALFGTRDGGAHWTPLTWKAAWHFVGGRRGHATDGEAIYRTLDGGRSWTRVRTAAGLVSLAETDAGDEAGGSARAAGEPFIMGVRFVDRYNGFAEVVQGGLQRLFRTRSLGQVWKPVYRAEEGDAGELVHFSMSDGKNGLAIDARGNLRATGDGARTWPVQIRSEDFDLTGIHFADRRRGWAAGRTGRILVTEDGGNHWREVRRRIGTPFLDVETAALPPGGVRVWAGGAGGRIAVSNPEGRAWRSPWRVQATPTRNTVHDIDFLDARRGAAVGDDGLVLLTEDGGAGWRRVRTGAAETLRAVVYQDRALFLVAGGRTLLVSRDGAKTFAPAVPRRFLNSGTLVSADAPDPRHLFALQEEGFVLRSEDGGRSWIQTPVGESARLVKIQFSDASRGWILGRGAAGGSVLYLTDDGGASWRETALPGLEARSFYFVDRRLGWMVAPQAILHSMDGGRNWRRQRLAPSRFIRDFEFVSRDGAWAVGDNGFAARYVAPRKRSSIQGD